jgi:hypothetical protein
MAPELLADKAAKPDFSRVAGTGWLRYGMLR